MEPELSSCFFCSIFKRTVRDLEVQIFGQKRRLRVGYVAGNVDL